MTATIQKIAAAGLLVCVLSSPAARAQNSGIFGGGDGDGSGMVEAGGDPAPFLADTNQIFGGGDADGHGTQSAGNGPQPFLSSNSGIFAGGIADGHDVHQRSGDQSAYENYMVSFGLRGALAAMDNDFDLDGWLNVEEFGYGSAPDDFRGRPLLLVDPMPEGFLEPVFGLLVPRRSGGSTFRGVYEVDKLRYFPQGSRDLAIWNERPLIEVLPGDGLPPGYEYALLILPRHSPEGEALPRGFIRMGLQY